MKRIITVIAVLAMCGLCSCASEPPLTNNPQVNKGEPVMTAALEETAETLKNDAAAETPEKKDKSAKPTVGDQIELLRKYKGRIAAGYEFIAGAADDGTVRILTTDSYPIEFSQAVSAWTDVIYLAASSDTLFGLRSDGTVLSAVSETAEAVPAVSGLTGISAIAAEGENFAYIRSDGTVGYISLSLTDKPSDWADVSEWSGITEIDVGEHCIVGLRNDGTVAACFDPDIPVEDTDAEESTADTEAAQDAEASAEGSTDENKKPEKDPYAYIAKLKNVVSVAAGGDCEIYTLKKDGTLYRNDRKIDDGLFDTKAVSLCANASSAAWIDADMNGHYGSYFYDRGIPVSMVSGGYAVYVLKSDGTVSAIKHAKGDPLSGWQEWKLFDSEIEELKAFGKPTNANESMGDSNAEVPLTEELVSPGCHTITADQKYSAIQQDGTIFCFDRYGNSKVIKDYKDPVAVTESDTYLYITLADGSMGIYDLLFDKKLNAASELLGSNDDKKSIENVSKYDYGAVLHKDGTVSLAGLPDVLYESFEPVHEWENIADISFYDNVLFGITQDGRVKSVYYEGSPYTSVKTEVESWSGIKKIAYSRNNAVFGLKTDGTVIASDISGSNAYLISLLSDVSDADDIAVLYSYMPTVYIRHKDGIVSCFRYLEDGGAAQTKIAENIAEINIMGGRHRNNIVMKANDGELLSTAHEFRIDDPFRIE